MNVYLYLPPSPLNPAAQHQHAQRLLDYALQAEYGVTLDDCGEIARTALGKPYFKPTPLIANTQNRQEPVHFSYAHCADAVVCVVARENVGVDIQAVTTPKPAVIRRVCCVSERDSEAVMTAEGFTEMWVQKEAYAKFTGKGLTEGFNTIDTTDKSRFCPKRVFRYENFCIAVYSTFRGATRPQVQVVQL
ncbi:MAG: 4'-phosphopantetheinyl transferase superfamily protein [Oscillospiraceae bacterium]|nr:4'-phosphopantetheinyl transferase superfamily protein [Oscillospiraceae bacterium]